MSNPLIIMTNFSLQNVLDADNPNGENSGRATLRFYVRGISKDDLLYLRETIKSRQEEFSRKITESLKKKKIISISKKQTEGKIN